MLQVISRNVFPKLFSSVVPCWRQNIISSCSHLTAACSTSVDSKPNTEEELSFEELLKNSPLTKLGRCFGKVVVGKVTDICNNDLYVDFGGKFEVVVKIPKTGTYERGTLVLVTLRKFEMTGAFYGDERHVTLCEADGGLKGLYLWIDKAKQKAE